MTRAAAPAADEWEEYVAARWAQFDGGEVAAEYQRCVRPYLAGPVRSALDVGVGPGQHLAALAALAPGAVLTGVDADERYLERARTEISRRGVSAELRVADGCALPYCDGSYDLVVTHLTLPYARDDRAFLRECARVLAPNGCLWLTTHGVGFFVRSIATGTPYLRARYLGSLLAGALSMTVGKKPLRDTPVTPGWLARNLRACGLVVRRLDWNRYGPWPRILSATAGKPAAPADAAREGSGDGAP